MPDDEIRIGDIPSLPLDFEIDLKRFRDLVARSSSITARIIKEMKDAKEAARNHSIHFGPGRVPRER